MRRRGREKEFKEEEEDREKKAELGRNEKRNRASVVRMNFVDLNIMKYETGYKMPKLCQHQNYSPSIFSQTLRNKERRYIFVVRRETSRGNRYGSLFGVFF